jgi:CRP/FNR family transcriptional regulator, dissimilatory nitrate respiration regulator
VIKIDWLPAGFRAAASEHRLKPGQTLFRRGNRTSGLYEILEGQVRLVRVNRDGREQCFTWQWQAKR